MTKTNLETMMNNVITKVGMESPVTIEFCEWCEKPNLSELELISIELAYNVIMELY